MEVIYSLIIITLMMQYTIYFCSVFLDEVKTKKDFILGAIPFIGPLLKYCKIYRELD